MRKFLLPFLFLIAMISVTACGGKVIPPPDPDPEPEPCIKGDNPCKYGGIWKKRKCEWLCNEPPPPPPPEIFPSNYIAVERVESILFYQTKKWEGLFPYATNLTWAGSRDIRDVVRYCPVWGSELLGYNDDIFLTAADSGELLSQETSRFIRKFWLRDDPHNDRNWSGEPIINKRCDPDHEQHAPEFCEKTNVKKDVFKEFTGRLLVYNSWANGLRVTAQECKWENMGTAFDSIIGWCRRMDAWGYKTCP